MALLDLVWITLREVVRFLISYVVERVFYWPGWLILRVLTFGRYPPLPGSPHNETFVALVAFATFYRPGAGTRKPGSPQRSRV